MSLPNKGREWPPLEYRPALDQVRRDLGIVNGELNVINGLLPQAAHPQPYRARAQYNGGLVGGVARGVLGKPAPDPRGEAKVERHLPVAEELVAASANLLAEKPMSVTLHEDDEGNEPAKDALSRLTGTDEFAAQVWESAWHRAAAGWVYGRVVWNTEIDQHPWIEFVDADQGYAEFENGRQAAITFWDTYKPDTPGRATYRLLQRHAPGAIEYGLYEGTETELGIRVPVDAHEAAAHLAPILDADSEIKTGTHLLTARMILNLDRNTSWRHDPTLRYYGKSDIAKGGGLWSDIDRAWTELWHEVEAGRHRLLVSEDLLNVGPPGQGAVFDWMRDVFPVGPSGDPNEGPTIESVQAELRVDRHLTVVDASTRKAIDAVGLSPMTVGMDPQASGQMTATETRARSDKTIKTFGGKARQTRAGMSELLTAYLHLDAHLNGYTPPVQRVNVSVVEPVQDTELEQAQRLKELRGVNLSSIEHGVESLHPEWTDEQHQLEVQRIYRELNMGMPADPFEVGVDEPFRPGDE